MRRLFKILTTALTVVLAIGMTACNNGEGGSGARLTLSPSALTFDSNGGEKQINVIGADWVATVNQTWIEITPQTGSNGVINVIVEANETGASRIATIEVVNAAGKKTVSIEQGVPGQLLVAPQTLEFTGEAGTQTVSVSSDDPWTVSEDEDWITVSKSNDSFNVTVLKNNLRPRTGVITVDNGIETKEVLVNQGEMADDGAYPFVEAGLNYLHDNFQPGRGTYQFRLSLYGFYTYDMPWSGTYVSIDFTTVEPSFAKMNTIDIPAGTYTFSNEGGAIELPGTIRYTFQSSIQVYSIGADGKSQVTPVSRINGGNFTVEGDSDYYNITVDLTFENGMSVRGRYKGPLYINNPYYDGPMSTFTEDQNFGAISSADGEIHYYGTNNGQFPDCNIWLFWVTSPTVFIGAEAGDDYMGNGYILNGQLSATINDGSYIPDGTYTIIQDNTYEPGYLRHGFGNMQGGTWFRELKNDQTIGRSSLQSGTVVITRSGANTYTFTVDAVDDAGYSVAGTFTGDLELQRKVNAM